MTDGFPFRFGEKGDQGLGRGIGEEVIDEDGFRLGGESAPLDVPDVLEIGAGRFTDMQVPSFAKTTRKAA